MTSRNVLTLVASLDPVAQPTGDVEPSHVDASDDASSAVAPGLGDNITPPSLVSPDRPTTPSQWSDTEGSRSTVARDTPLPGDNVHADQVCNTTCWLRSH